MADILIVDDEQITILSLKEELKELGHNVVGVAKSGPMAVKKAKAVKPDLILMDISMPGTFDGIEAAKRVEKKFSIPVIFITAYESEHFLEKIKTLGPFGYLTKPYKKFELEACIHIALYRKRMESQLEDQYKNEVLINNILTQVTHEFDSFENIPGILSTIAKSLKISKICLCEQHKDELELINCVCDKKFIKRKNPKTCVYNFLKTDVIKKPSEKVVVDNLTQLNGVLKVECGQFDFKSLLYLPLYIEKVQFGGMIFINKNLKNYFTPEIERLLTIVCNIISIILEKHYKYLRIKKIEQEKLLKEKMVMRANRFASLGQLSSSISHEISQPLHKIKILADSAIYWEKNNKKIPYSDLMESQRKISDYVTHIDKIIKNLKLLIKSPEKLKQQSANINTAVGETIELYKQKLENHSIELSLSLKDRVEEVSLSDVLLQQIIINLLENSINALDCVEKENKLIKIETGMNKNSSFLRITDNGPGVDNEIKEEIFQPFFSVNSKYRAKGLGMGLYIVHNILELINGNIEVQDNKSGGASFNIVFNHDV